MGELTRWLFNPSGLTPHGFCLLWNPSLIWLHAVSDLGIGLAYFSIPFALVFIMRHRPDLVFRPLFGLFAAFILLCGIGHCLDVLTLWVPAYGVEGLVKAMTFCVSAVTAITIWTLMPHALALPSPAQLRQANLDLRAVKHAELRMEAAAREASIARDVLALELGRREAAELRMRESEERFQILLQSRVVEALYLLDPDGRIETWNAGAERIKGYAAAEVIGRNFAMFFSPEDVAAGEPARLLATARAEGRYSAELWRVRKDGSRFLAQVSVDAVHRQDGSLRGFVKVTRDITDRRIEEEQRAIIIDAAPNGMMIVDESGKITLANSQCERIFEYPPGTLAGQSVESLVPDALRATHVAVRSRFTGGEDVRSMATGRVFIGRRWGGGDVPIEILLTPVKTPRGRIVVAAIFDTTERQRLEAERHESELRDRRAVEATNARLDRLSQDLSQARDRAEHASQAKSRFLATITHELRTPLHGILGYAELMHLEDGLTPKQSQRLEVMMAAGHHLLAMVNSVLDMSQIEADRLELHPGPAELSALVGLCLDVVRPSADAKGLALIQAPSAPLHVVVDATRLQQVLINLLGNAVKFTPVGSVAVRLRETQAGACFRLDVADTGPGVRPAHREKLFQTFERLNAEAVSGIEGTGLGLAVAARLVQLMGGQIGYEDNPGGGSIFWLELPAHRATAAPAAETVLPAAAAATRRMRVLVADDEPLNRSIAREFLCSAGHEVVCVNDGAAAVEAVSTGDYDAILMDVRMPGMNGLEATRRIRDLPAPRGEIWVVAVTAQAFAQQIETCRRAGMDSHVSKPFTKAGLLAALAEQDKVQRDAAADATEPPAAPLDRATLEAVAAHLPAATVGGYLRDLETRCEALRHWLGTTARVGGDAALAEEAHRLAGSSGILGFASIAAAARLLEVAAETGAADCQARAEDLTTAITAALPVIRREFTRMTAAVEV